MPDIPSIFNLEILGDPYSAEVIPSTEPPADGCILPSMVSIPTLPAIDITLPEIQCKYNVDYPVIAPPYFCPPTFTGSINFTACDQDVPISISGDAVTLDLVEDTECQYRLNGNIELCLPCIQTIEGGLTISACDTAGNPITVTGGDSITIQPKAGTECGMELVGAVTLCAPCIPSVSALISIRTNTDDPLNALTISEVVPIHSAYDAETCQYVIGGELVLDVPVPEAVCPDGVSITAGSPSTVTKSVTSGSITGSISTSVTTSIDNTDACNKIVNVSVAIPTFALEVAALSLPDGLLVNTDPLTTTGDCADSSTWPSLGYIPPVGDTPGQLYLAGGFPPPCFFCDPEMVGDNGFQFSEIDLDILHTRQIVQADCCADTVNHQSTINMCEGWIDFVDAVATRECYLDPNSLSFTDTATGQNTITIANHSDGSLVTVGVFKGNQFGTLEATDGDDTYLQIKSTSPYAEILISLQDILSSDAPSGSSLVKLREMTFCVNGASKRALVLMSDFYD